MDRTLRVVEYTQQVGRSLKNIRNYNPRTTLHTKLPEKRDRILIESVASNGPIHAIVNTVANEYGLYAVLLYPDGYNNAPTETAFMYLPQASYGSTVAVGTRLIVYWQQIEQITGTYDDGEDDEGE